jgi:hypothetical protein
MPSTSVALGAQELASCGFHNARVVGKARDFHMRRSQNVQPELVLQLGRAQKADALQDAREVRSAMTSLWIS